MAVAQNEAIRAVAEEAGVSVDLHFYRVRSYLSTARKQGRPPLHAPERALAGKPLQLGTAPA